MNFFIVSLFLTAVVLHQGNFFFNNILVYDHSSLFSLHPTFMILSYLFFVPNAIYAKKKGSQNKHFLYNLLGALSAAAAAYAIFLSKEQNNRPHLATLHSQFGVVVVAMHLAMFLFSFLFKGILKLQLPGHSLGGKAIFVFAIGASIYGWQMIGKSSDVYLTAVLFGLINYGGYYVFFK